MMRQLAGSILFAALVSTVAEAQTTRKVPQDFPTIQAAIVASQNGDTVRVAPGVYVENINFLGKAITVVSVAGADFTTIDGGFVASVVTFNNGEGLSSVLDGFTIRNGKGTTSAGGGVRIVSASPSIRRNHIINNFGCDGAGILVSFSSALIQGNVISNNNNSPLPCSGSPGGGGISISGAASAQILDNTISNNTTLMSGGGLSLFAAGTPLIRGNIITGNSTINGGGISMLNTSDARIIQNVIAGNTATQIGGGSGGGIYASVPSGAHGPWITNNTIVDNDGGQIGSAIALDGFDNLVPIKNNIIIGKTGQPAVYCGNWNNLHLQPIFASNDVFSSQAPAYTGFCADPTGTNGNVSVDPLFADRAGQNFRLLVGSAGIDAGDNTVPDLIATDLDSYPRILPSAGTVDMGAYEFTTPTTATISSNSLTFADQNAGSSSAPIAVNLTNTGTSNLLVSSVTISGDFSQTNTCQTQTGIAAGLSCTVSVRFAPTAGGPRSGQLTIANNSGINIVSLSGTGLAALTLSTTSVSFGDQRVGTTSPAIPLSLSNNGFVDLNISSVSTTGDFTNSNDCPPTMTAGSSCTISIGFAPTARGARFGTITINALGTLSIVTLSGTGLAPTSDFSTSSLQYTNQVVGTTSASQIVTISNHGDMALTISSISFNGDYNGTNNCGGSLGVNGTCTINVAFSPTATGVRNGSIVVSDDAIGSPHTIALNGSGTAAVMSATPSSLTFGNQAINTASASKIVTLRNTGTALMTITSIVASTEFSKSGTCGALPVGSSCTITVTFNPTSVGPKTGTLTITDSAIGSPHTVALSGTGVDVAFSPAVLIFGDVHIGTTATRTVTVANNSSNAVNITSLTITAGYSYTSTCGTSLSSGASCTVDVIFSPVTAGPNVPGTLTMTDDAIGSPHTLPLSGRGVSGTVSLSSTTLTYGSDLVGTTSLPQTVTVSNFGSGPLTFSGITASGDFTQTTTCGTTLAISANCSITVLFSATAPGTRTGSLTITSDGTVSTSSVALTGTGLAALAVPVLSTMSPDNTAVGASGITLSITGTGFSSLSVVRWGGSDRPTTFVSNTTLTAAIPASDFATMGTTPVSIFNPSPGGGTSTSAGFIVYRATTLTTKDLIYDRIGGRIYASVPATAPIRANTLTPLDPMTGVFGTSAPIGTDPGRLAISNDSSFIYVALDGDAKVRRFDTASQSPGIAFTLGTDPFYGPYYAGDIAISPGKSDTIAVSRRVIGVSPQHAGVAIYDSGVKRPNETPSHTGSNQIEFSASSSRLYGYNFESTEFGFRTMSVDTSGVAITNVQTGLISGFGTDIQFEGGRIYSTNGRVIDPDSSAILGTFPLPIGGDLRAVAADSTLQRAFFIFATPTATRIIAFDLNTFLQTGSVSLPGQSNTFSLSSLIRWGETGLAFRSGTQVFTFQIPESWLGPHIPTIALTPDGGQQGQVNLNIAITGQLTNFTQGQPTANFGAGITVNSITFADATHATANITIAAGAATGLRNVSISAPASGGGRGTFAVVGLPGLLAGWGAGSAQTGIPTGLFKAIAAGDSHSLAIRTDGTLVGWGSNSQGQINVPSGTFIAIAAGDSHSLAIRTDGTLVGWGANDFGQINVPSGTFTAIAAGAVHSLAIRTDGTLVGWGANSFGQTNVPSGTYTAIAAGVTHSLAIRTDGTLIGWGTNSSGQPNVPTGTFTAVAAGDMHSLALRTDGTLVGWGVNSSGQINVPSGTFTAIAAGEKSGFAIRTDGTVVSWGDTTFGNAPAGTFRSITASRNRGVAIGKSPTLPRDFNGDNKSDVLWRDTTGKVYVWQMNGFTVTSDTLIANIWPDWKIVGSGDFNADGKMDILWRDGSGTVAVWLMDGTTVSSYAIAGNMPVTWAIAAVADFNADGKADILWRNTTGDVAIWLMNGSTIASNTTIANIFPGWTISGTGDFNADGKADILWREASGDVGIWLMNGTSVLSSTVIANIYPGWSIVGTGDFNADGKADILWREASGDVGIWLMNGTSVASTRVVANIWMGWTIAGTGDFNADGKTDILWRDGSGNVSMWFMDGTAVANWSGIGNVADRIAQ